MNETYLYYNVYFLVNGYCIARKWVWETMNKTYLYNAYFLINGSSLTRMWVWEKCDQTHL